MVLVCIIMFILIYYILTPCKGRTKELRFWNRTRPAGLKALFYSRALNKEK